MQIHHRRSTVPTVLTGLEQSPFPFLGFSPVKLLLTVWFSGNFSCQQHEDFAVTAGGGVLGGEGWFFFEVSGKVSDWKFWREILPKSWLHDQPQMLECWKLECLECREGCCAFENGINLTLANDHSTSIYDEIVVPGDTLNDHGWNLVDLPFLFVVFRLIVFSRRGSSKLQILGVSLVNSRIMNYEPTSAIENDYVSHMVLSVFMHSVV